MYPDTPYLFVLARPYIFFQTFRGNFTIIYYKNDILVKNLVLFNKQKFKIQQKFPTALPYFFLVMIPEHNYIFG